VQSGTEYVSVYTTFPDRDTAGRIGRQLVEEDLCACANLFVIHSIYRWRGALEETGEWAALLKTRRDRYDHLEERLRALHPYETPAVVAFPIDRGSPDYLAWIGAQTGLRKGGEP
jgi:periplasmic divalent cation tolerance protein